MYRLTTIQDELLNLVGWEQSYNPAKKISDSLTHGTSGMTYQSAHPLLTLDNIEAIMPDNYAMQYVAWDDAREYTKGDKVKQGNLYYIATDASTNQTPSAGSQYWTSFNPLSDYLETLTRNGITKLVQTFIDTKQLRKETSLLMERKSFFDGAANINNTIESRHRLVGLAIVPVRSMGVTMRIERIGLQMRGATGVIKLYLFHSSLVEPIKTYEVDFTSTNGGFMWFDLQDCYLPYIGSNTDAGGQWYICYNQDELPLGMEALNVSKDWSREPCSTCNNGNIETWRELQKYAQVTPFCYGVNQDEWAERKYLWQIDRTIYTPTTNYGINAIFSIGCDLTDLIVSQKHLFQTALQLQVAAIALRTMAMNPNVNINRNQSNVSRMDVLYELDGNTGGRAGGIGYELSRAYKAIELDTKGLDRICLACNNRGVRYTSM